jgi:Family of unknown function (DUF6978)
MLTQTEADALIAMDKSFVNPVTVNVRPGINQTHELIGADPKERFLLDLWRGTIRLSKYRFQTRGRQVIVLVRLDLNGAPHTNPDGSKIGGTHVHVYREGYEDRWASPIDPAEFKNLRDVSQTFRDFCDYCKIENHLQFQVELL